MTDYIERQAALHAVNEFFHDPKVDIALNALPAANARENVQGTPILNHRPKKYEKYEEYGLNENGEMLYLKHVLVDEKNYVMYCSCCGKRLCSRFMNFCPNCGARMVTNNASLA